MGWHDLVCAACAGPVSEGRCSVCRASRAEFRLGQLTPALVAALALVVALIAACMLTLARATA